MTQTSPAPQATGNNLVVQGSIEVNAPISEVYRRWTDFQSYPQFMSNIEQVTPLGDNRYHVRGGKEEWDTIVTEMEPNRQIAWHNTAGRQNAGTVTLDSTGTNQTMVRMRMEYAPPASKIGQALLDTTHVFEREVRQDLENFKQVIQGGTPKGGTRMRGGTATRVPQTAQMAPEMVQIEEEYAPGVGGVLRPLAFPVAASIAGGTIAYFVGKRARRSAAYKAYVSPVHLPNAIGAWGLTGASVASVLGAAAMRSRGDMQNALFIGQWAPTFLGLATLTRLMGDRRLTTSLPTSVMSWSYVAGSLASVGWSAILQRQKKYKESRFVGQWAPTLLDAAVFTRLFRRLMGR
jgi:uncharacterized membrane protein